MHLETSPLHSPSCWKTEMEVGKTFESINLGTRNNFRSIFKSILTFKSCGRNTFADGVLSRSVMSNSFATPWTIALQAPLSVGSPRWEYWSALPVPSPDLLNPGIKLMSPALAGRLFTTIATWEVPFADYEQIIPVAQMTITITRKNRNFMKLPTAQTSMLLT